MSGIQCSKCGEDIHLDEESGLWVDGIAEWANSIGSNLVVEPEFAAMCEDGGYHEP